jgi:hypothetical protein
MISTPTTFILGAGASAPYGFPTGKALVDKVLENLESEKYIRQILELFPDQERAIETFADQLNRSRKLSVDAFLEHRPEYSEIGKTAIAQALIPYETEEALFSKENNGDWYRYLLDQMNTKFENFAENAVSFVTFNYDRSLEYCLYSALLATYGKTRAEVAQVVRAFPIIHLHGSLTKLPLLESETGRQYEPNVDTHSLEMSWHNIRIISELHDTESDELFKAAREIIRRSQIICFLGFGYGETNLRRIGVPAIIDSQRVFGTAMNHTHLQKGSVERRFDKKITLASSDRWDSLEFLKQQVELA